MKNELFPHQVAGVEWLKARRHALLADEMGLGKTAQVIRAAEESGIKRILVICPAVARFNWQNEFLEWRSRKSKTLSKVMMSLKDRTQNASTVICSFDYAVKNWKLLVEEEWDLLVIDEVHFLKSTGAKRSKSIFGAEGLAHKAKAVWALSGTPAPNHAGELWILLYSFGITSLSYDAFVARYCVTIETGYGLKIVGSQRLPELRALLEEHVMLRRKKTDVLKDLPALFFSEFVVNAGDVDIEMQASMIQYIGPHAHYEDLALKLKEEREILGLALLTTPDQMKTLEALATSVSTLRRYTGLQKVAPVAQLVSEELQAGLYKKVVIFAVHKDVVKGLKNRLQPYGVVTITGDVGAVERQRAVDGFQTDPTIRVFIGNIHAAGTNLTLTSAHQVVFVEQDWVPGNNLQAAARCHRIGQSENVSVRFISLKNPMDEKVTQILRRKTQELEELFC